ncbi:MAG: hypothetical protein H6Q59_3240 [Firmicutes bacterium]|nr:hypothetical protein [Bacillota bacterium]
MVLLTQIQYYYDQAHIAIYIVSEAPMVLMIQYRFLRFYDKL